MTTRTNENTFDVELSGVSPDRNINQMSQSININSVNVYQFMSEAYFGTGGFRSGAYILAHDRELNYSKRMQLAHYKNYVKPIIRAMVEPCFSQIATRVVKDESENEIEDSIFLQFIDNCDVCGTHLQDYTHSALNICRRHGVVFTVMDNYSKEMMPATLADAERLRMFPYIYTKQANEVEEFKTDKFGNLETITFIEEPEIVNGKKESRWRQWTTTESTILGKNSSGQFYVVSTVTHNLGKVPVIVSFSDTQEDKTNILPEPPLYDIAKLNYVIFNQATEIRELERSQSFAIFYAQGLPPGDHTFGTGNFINLPTDVNITPGYTSPDPGTLTNLVANQEQIRKDLYLIAEQAGVVGIQNSESGIAKSYDFFAHEDTLKRTSSIATTLEMKIAELFMLYTKESFVYLVDYPFDFSPMGLDRDITRISTIYEIPELTTTFKYKLQEKLARLVFADDTRETMNEVIESIHEAEEKAEEEPVDPEEAAAYAEQIRNMDPNATPEEGSNGETE